MAHHPLSPKLFLAMTAKAEETIADLRKRVSEIKARVSSLEASGCSNANNEVNVLSERVTQALIEVDSVDDVSKGAAAGALRAKDRKTAMAIAVLVARKKTLVKELNELGDRIDSIKSNPEAAQSQIDDENAQLPT